MIMMIRRNIVALKECTAVQVPVYSVTCLYFGRIDSVFYDFVALSHFFLMILSAFLFSFLIFNFLVC